jgi:hypothetical protein
MTRAAFIIALSAFLAGCASVMDVEVSAHAIPVVNRASDDVECLSECLQDGAEDCETCAVHCLGHTPSSSTHADEEPDSEAEVADNTA